MRILLLTFLVTSLSFGIIQVGESVPNLCWKDSNAQKLCLADDAGKVRVLIFNTGWCPDCVAEFEELVPKVKKYDATRVQFYSLSAEGFKSGMPADSAFLEAWKNKFNIFFPVLASPRDPGRLFFDPPVSIPNVIVIDAKDKLHYKAMEGSVEELLMHIDQLL